MGISRITKKEHFVPQTYLRRFSGDGKRIWSYEIDSTGNSKYIPIESVCRKDYLYEVKDNNGHILSPNWIEHCLSILEGMFATYFMELENKALVQESNQRENFLTTEEISFWKAYVLVQMMRTPEVLNAAIDVVKDFSNDFLNDNQRRAIALSQCLPLFNELKPDDKNVFNAFLKLIDKMNIGIGVDESEMLFTSDNPVYCFAPLNKDFAQIKECDMVVMALSSKYVLLLFGGKRKKEYENNRLFTLSSDCQETVKLSVAYAARKWIFSKEKLSLQDCEIITRARRDKIQDELNRTMREFTTWSL